MSQLRQDYNEIAKREAEIVMVGPDGPNAFRRLWDAENMPFIGLADVGSTVADTFYQKVSFIKLGRMPAMFVIDKNGKIRFSHYGESMSDIPQNQVILNVLDRVNQQP